MMLNTQDLDDSAITILALAGDGVITPIDLLEQLDIYNNAFTKMPKALAPDGDMEEEGCNIVREEP